MIDIMYFPLHEGTRLLMTQVRNPDDGNIPEFPYLFDLDIPVKLFIPSATDFADNRTFCGCAGDEMLRG